MPKIAQRTHKLVGGLVKINAKPALNKVGELKLNFKLSLVIRNFTVFMCT